MRLHHLSVTAFGPFADTVEVDFDDLSEAGLFLLTGPTGAGKTSVLDAVCFALYGQVPGDRQGAKHLRCDQAPVDSPSEVTLEASLRGRRLRIVRSPGWQRPKKRGTGTTTQQPSVRVTERVDGAWVPRATRLDEAGDFLGRLVGLTLTQFCQVAMLPQGEFQAFLRADSASRQRLLQQLFRTTRFDEVEHWLKDRRRALARASAGHHDTVADLVSRVSEVADTEQPSAWDDHDLTPVADELLPWALARHDRAAEETATLEEAVSAARFDAEQATVRVDQARELAARQAAHAAALAESTRLDARAADHAAAVEALRRARKAAPVASLHEAAQVVLAELDRAEADLAAVLGDRDADPVALEEAEREALAASTRARDAEPRAAQAQQLAVQVSADDDHLAAHSAELAELDEALRELPDRLGRLTDDERAARDAATGLAGAGQACESLAEQLASARDAVRLAEELTSAQVLLQASVDAAQDARDRWQVVRERRLQGFASELARGLAVGADCPVCGSADHPHPASAASDSPDAAAEKAAQATYETAAFERQTRELAVQDLQTRLSHAEAGAGDVPVDALVERLDAAHAALAGLRARAATLDRVTADLSLARQQQTEVTSRRASLESRRAALTAASDERRSRLSELEAELAALLRDTGCTTVTALADQHAGQAKECAAARSALTRRDHARASAATARDRARRAARSAGFAGLDEALDAVLADAEVDALAAEVDEHRAALARCRAALDDETLRAAAAEPAPDTEALEVERSRCTAVLADLDARHRRTVERRERLDRLTGALRDACSAWTPVRADLELVTRLAGLVDGTSPDNRLRMSLTGYVLAWRLSQVVAAANERLLAMYDERLSLEHTGRRGARETRGGLSLLVRDDWSGVSRDPATLSGGETFMVSLALALGLADVIAHEAGGAELDTLFVDEGFGSLDAETLDKVMGTLDSLRDGGRVVGVVSHVAEMRDRIPAQLHVRTRRDGTSEVVRRTVG